MAQAVTNGCISGDGQFTLACANLLEATFEIKKVLMTPSCTAALEMAAILCEFEPGDEVIMPSYTFVSTATAFVREGATPVFVDIRPDTLNIDEKLIEESITPRTKAIVVVHYAGVACEMDTIMRIAEKHNLIVIEDAAQGVNSFYKGRALGSIGHVGCYSFHETKNYICGEGGALCINDAEMIERAEIIRDKGTNRQRFFRGQVDKYTWVDVGSSYVPSEISCAFLFAQLELLDEIAKVRKSRYQFYQEQLENLAATANIELPQIPEACTSNFHMFYVLLESFEARCELIEQLKRNRIQAVFHYIPLHSSPASMDRGFFTRPLPVTDSVSSRLLRLPFFHDITFVEQQRVVDSLVSFFDPAESIDMQTEKSLR